MANTSRSRKKVVSVGGGNGPYMLGDGLRDMNVDVTILSTPADSGGDSGDIRDELGEILPPGDLRRGINALIDPRYSAQLRSWLDLRVPIGNGKKRNVGNYIISSAMKKFGMIEGLKFVEELLHVQGTVLPMSTDNVQLRGKLSDGTILRSESEIDLRPLDDERLLIDVWLEPNAHIHREAAQELYDADLITIGPGDLHSSIAAAMKVKGFKEVIAETKAIIVAIPSLMTKWSETRDYQLHDFVGKMAEWLGRDFDFSLINTGEIPPLLLQQYVEKEKSTPILVRDAVDLDKLKRYSRGIHAADLLSKPGLDRGLIRHDSRKTVHALMDLLYAPPPMKMASTEALFQPVGDSLGRSSKLLQQMDEREQTQSR